MVFRKKKVFQKRNYNRSRKSRYTTWGSARFLAKKALYGIRKIRGLVNSELYKYDQSQTAVSMSNAGSTLPLTNIGQGDTDVTRTGNSIYVKSVNIRGTMAWNAAGAAQQYCKIALVEDSQQIGDTTPGFTDIWSQGTTYGHLNHNTVGRFKILKTYMCTLSVNKPGQIFEMNVPMQHHVRFNGTASTDIQKGGLYFMYCSNSSTNYPTLDYEVRVSYHDN